MGFQHKVFLSALYSLSMMHKLLFCELLIAQVDV